MWQMVRPRLQAALAALDLQREFSAVRLTADDLPGDDAAWYRLLPSLAATSVTMALSTRLDPRVAAGVVSAMWILIVTVAVSATDAAAAFGPTMQVLSLFVASGGAVAFAQRRRRLDVMTDR